MCSQHRLNNRIFNVPPNSIIAVILDSSERAYSFLTHQTRTQFSKRKCQKCIFNCVYLFTYTHTQNLRVGKKAKNKSKQVSKLENIQYFVLFKIKQQQQQRKQLCKYIVDLISRFQYSHQIRTNTHLAYKIRRFRSTFSLYFRQSFQNTEINHQRMDQRKYICTLRILSTGQKYIYQIFDAYIGKC